MNRCKTCAYWFRDDISPQWPRIGGARVGWCNFSTAVAIDRLRPPAGGVSVAEMVYTDPRHETWLKPLDAGVLLTDAEFGCVNHCAK